MTTQQDDNRGFVYILEVKDIDLPVCKIGRTSRNPLDRCIEINRSSTGDFLWQVAYEFPVNDCNRFERLVHKKLEPLRQKNREFFNITAAVASDAIQSILITQSEIETIARKDIGTSPAEALAAKKNKKSRIIQFRQKDSEYTEILALFTKIMECKGRPFGQLNKPYFGMSDGNEGVQWNIAIHTEAESIQLGVNLEGLTYTNWPIATMLLKELDSPGIFEATGQLTNSDQVFLRLTRDAWQAAARPSIVEKFIGPGDISIKSIDTKLWQSMLEEAIECLSEEREYRGRASQLVTLANQPSHGNKTRRMGVSPHLTIWTPIEPSGDLERNLKLGRDRLTPVYDWVSSVSQ